MQNLNLRIRRFLQDEVAVTSIEYVLIASLIAVIILGAVSVLGTQVCEGFRSVASALGITVDDCT